MEPTRRDWMASIGLGASALALSNREILADIRTMKPAGPFLFGLNTSTLMGQQLPISEIATIAAGAGYQGIEPWVRELEAHEKAGKSLKDLGKQLADTGLSVESSIGFFEWCVDDDSKRKKALEDARRSMDLVARIGGKRIAAPASGATDVSGLDLNKIADRYRTLLELGDSIGVVPEVEVWGFSKTLGTLADAAYVAIASGHPRACILPDVYHLYKGGSAAGGLRVLNGNAIHAIHMNDYPDLPRATIDDSQRVYPGDGIAPIGPILKTLHEIGFKGMLSLELFNKSYWSQDPKIVAKTGLEKMKIAVKAALGA